MEDAPGIRIDERIIVGAVELVFDIAPDPGHRVLRHADHVRRAADRVAVLQPVSAGVVPAGQVFAQPRGDIGLSGMGLGLEDGRVEVSGAAVERDRGQRRQAGRQADQVLGAGVGQAGQPRHHRRAVHQRQSLLGRQLERGMPQRPPYIAGCPHLAIEQDVALAHQRRGDIGQRCEVAAGAHRTLRRNARQDVVVDQVGQALQQRITHARIAMGQRVQPRRDDGQRFGRGQVAPHPATVVARELQRQRLHQGRWNADFAGVAVSGIDAVDRCALCQLLLQEAGTAFDAIPPCLVAVQGNRCLPSRDGDDRLDGQMAIAEADRRGARPGDCGRHQIVFSHGRPFWGVPRNRRN